MLTKCIRISAKFSCSFYGGVKDKENEFTNIYNLLYSELKKAGVFSLPHSPITVIVQSVFCLFCFCFNFCFSVDCFDLEIQSIGYVYAHTGECRVCKIPMLFMQSHFENMR